jgi:nucleotide-binding universal stress UspA family protein
MERPERASPNPAPSEATIVARALTSVPCLRVQDGREEFLLDKPEVVIGRSRGCEILLDEPLVSRRHAKISVRGRELLLEDLGSVNGVYHNGTRVERPMVLSEGDRVLIGRTILIVGHVVQRPPAAREQHTIPMMPTESGARRAPAPQPFETSPDTGMREQGGFEMFGHLAEKALAMGRGAEAEKILSARLVRLLEEVRTGTVPPPAVCDQACRWAVSLASATGRGAWIDYAVDLYTALARPWPTPVIDELFDLSRKIDGISLTRLREYLRTLRAAMGQLGPAERFLVQRIEGIERVVASK